MWRNKSQWQKYASEVNVTEYSAGYMKPLVVFVGMTTIDYIILYINIRMGS